MVMRNTARAIIIHEDQLLVIARERMDRGLGLLQYYSIPGGMIEPHESSEQAVVRELHEEMLVDVRVNRYLGVIHLRAENVGERQYQDRVHYFYLCSGVVGLPVMNPGAPEIQHRLPGDLRFEPRWVPVTTATGEFHPDYQEVMAWVQQHRGVLEAEPAFEIRR